MSNIIVAGIGTDVGKTIVSAILMSSLKGDYWKPIQSGPEVQSDTKFISNLFNKTEHYIFPPTFSFAAPISPHHAARLENRVIELNKIILPKTIKPLIIESVGGIFVPLCTNVLSIDLFASWDCKWVVVSRNYLGYINHTLLTLQVLKQKNIPIAGLIFNGEINFDSENAILEISQVPMIGRLLPEKKINLQTILRYSTQWEINLKSLL